MGDSTENTMMQYLMGMGMGLCIQSPESSFEPLSPNSKNDTSNDDYKMDDENSTIYDGKYDNEKQPHDIEITPDDGPRDQPLPPLPLQKQQLLQKRPTPPRPHSTPPFLQKQQIEQNEIKKNGNEQQKLLSQQLQQLQQLQQQIQQQHITMQQQQQLQQYKQKKPN